MRQTISFLHLLNRFIQMSPLASLQIAVLWTIFTAILSLLPPGDSGILSTLHIPGLDKIGHFLFYFVMGLCWYLAAEKWKWKVSFIFIFCVTFGILLEFLQFYLSKGRQFEIADMLANTLGVGASMLLYKIKIN